MNKIYRIVTNPSYYWTNYESSKLVWDNGQKIYELWLEGKPYDCYNLYNLYPAYELCDSKPNENLEEYFFKEANHYRAANTGVYLISLIKQIPGNYFPRIYRPCLKKGMFGSNTIVHKRSNKLEKNNTILQDYFPADKKKLVLSVQQLNTLIERLRIIFNYLYPSSENKKAYGHEIRNLLILACTEVESQLKGVLTENNCKSVLSFYTTKDYVKLISVLQLDRYIIRLPHYPEVEPMSPFSKWSVVEPTKSLFWYDDYNAIKHNNEAEFHKGTLDSTINAVCGLCILLTAQYGSDIPYWNDLIGNFFEITESPEWDFHDCYVPPFVNEKWVPISAEI